MLFSSKALVASITKVSSRGFHASAKAEARKFFVGGNWKCNGSVAQTKELISMLNQCSLTQETEVVVCPSQVHLQSVKAGLRTDVAVGAQDCWVQGNGAFTGETSADMLTDMGVSWVVIGHSERRGKGESDVEVAKKAKYALDKGLSVIACCGEPLESREAGTTNDFVFPQIKAYADVFTKKDWKKVVIACKLLNACMLSLYLVFSNWCCEFAKNQTNPFGPLVLV
jgi:glyceraldehyde 3-phosphate dehydrogenase